MSKVANKKLFKEKLKPLLDSIGFKNSQKSVFFRLDLYRIQLQDIYERNYGSYRCYTLFLMDNGNIILLFKTYYIDTFIEYLKIEFNSRIRKYKIEKLLNG